MIHCAGHAAFVTAVRPLLSDPSEKIRLYTLEALAQLDDVDLTAVGAEIARLMQRTSHDDIISEAEDLAVNVDWGQHLQTVIEVLPNLGRRQRESLLDATSEHLGERHEAQVRPLLSHVDPDVQEWAVAFYERCGWLEPPAAIAGLLDDENEAVRVRALALLGIRVGRERLLREASGKSRLPASWPSADWSGWERPRRQGS